MESASSSAIVLGKSQTSSDNSRSFPELVAIKPGTNNRLPETAMVDFCGGFSWGPEINLGLSPDLLGLKKADLPFTVPGSLRRHKIV